MYSDDILKWSGVTIKTTTNATHGPAGYIYGGGAYFDGGSSYADEVSSLNVHATKNNASGSGYIYGGVLYAYNYLQLNGATFSTTKNTIPGAGAYIYGGVGYLDYNSNFTKVKANSARSTTSPVMVRTSTGAPSSTMTMSPPSTRASWEPR